MEPFQFEQLDGAKWNSRTVVKDEGAAAIRLSSGARTPGVRQQENQYSASLSQLAGADAKGNWTRPSQLDSLPPLPFGDRTCPSGTGHQERELGEARAGTVRVALTRTA